MRVIDVFVAGAPVARKGARGEGNGKHHLFTPAEDQVILRSMELGISWNDLSIKLGRLVSSISNRAKLLEKKKTAIPKQVIVNGVAHQICGSCQKVVPVSRLFRSQGKIKSYCVDCKNRKGREWKMRNRELVAERNHDYYQRHQEERSVYSRAHRERNTERRKETNRAWRESNPSKVRSAWQNRRARLLNLFVEEVDTEIIIARDSGICGICGYPVARVDVSIDHVIPLVKNGKHSYANTQLAHLICNKRKATS